MSESPESRRSFSRRNEAKHLDIRIDHVDPITVILPLHRHPHPTGQLVLRRHLAQPRLQDLPVERLPRIVVHRADERMRCGDPLPVDRPAGPVAIGVDLRVAAVHGRVVEVAVGRRTRIEAEVELGAGDLRDAALLVPEPLRERSFLKIAERLVRPGDVAHRRECGNRGQAHEHSADDVRRRHRRRQATAEQGSDVGEAAAEDHADPGGQKQAELEVAAVGILLHGRGDERRQQGSDREGEQRPLPAANEVNETGDPDEEGDAAGVGRAADGIRGHVAGMDADEPERQQPGTVERREAVVPERLHLREIGVEPLADAQDVDDAEAGDEDEVEDRPAGPESCPLSPRLWWGRGPG